MESFLNGRVEQHCGDALTVLRTLPADHFDCCVTSPPYWGLRDYGTAVWEGGNPACLHTGSERFYTEKSAAAGGSAEAFSQAGPENAERLKKARWRERGFCTKCGAIHCDYQLGLERSLGEHIAVMIDVFQEVRRVLKPTGTLWLNYGDCYATSPNGRSAADTKAAGNDDRTFRDKPFSTIGPIYRPDLKARSRASGKEGAWHGGEAIPYGRICAGGYLKPKDLCMVPNRLAIALQEAGWWVRSEIVWGKPNGMPDSSGRYRPSTAHEKIFLLSKSADCFYDHDAVRQRAAYADSGRSSAAKSDLATDRKRNGDDGSAASFRAIVENRLLRNYEPPQDKQRGHSRRHAGFNARWDHMSRSEQMENGHLLRNYEEAPLDVWHIPTSPFPEAHFATFPAELAERCIKAGCPEGGIVLDPFGGSGTTALVAASLGRRATLIELNPDYCQLAKARIEAGFMGKDEGARHMTKALGRVDEHPGPLFSTNAR